MGGTERGISYCCCFVQNRCCCREHSSKLSEPSSNYFIPSLGAVDMVDLVDLVDLISCLHGGCPERTVCFCICSAKNTRHNRSVFAMRLFLALVFSPRSRFEKGCQRVQLVPSVQIKTPFHPVIAVTFLRTLNTKGSLCRATKTFLILRTLQLVPMS